MTVKAGVDQIRAARRIDWVRDEPFLAQVLSTDSSYKHSIYFDGAVLVCDTCRRRFNRSYCWAVKKIEAALPAHVKARVQSMDPLAHPERILIWNGYTRQYETPLEFATGANRPAEGRG